MPRIKTMLSSTCLNCGIDFSVALKCSTRPAPKYCSKKCFSQSGLSAARLKANATRRSQKGLPASSSLACGRRERTMPCLQCGSIIDAVPSDHRIFCGVRCYAESLRGKDPNSLNPLRGGLPWQRRVVRNWYKNTCCRCGYNLVPEILQVHHKDHNPRNSVVENLELLCPNCHETEHFITKTGRFGSHRRNPEGRRRREPSYAFKKNASLKRLDEAASIQNPVCAP
jgi:hypothetical protein